MENNERVKYFGDIKIGNFVFTPLNLNFFECAGIAVLLCFVHPALFVGVFAFWLLKFIAKAFNLINTGE